MQIHEALGIAVGDKVSTSYGTGPYRVENIWGPFYWNRASFLTIWPYPVISLRLSYWGKQAGANSQGINCIHRDGNRWFSDNGDEIFVEKIDSDQIPRQLDIFGLYPMNVDARSFPYPMDPNVDYSDQNKVFHCWKCFRDFNGEKWNGGAANPHCPYCRAWVAMTVIVMEKVLPGERYWSEYQRYLGFIGRPE